MQEDLIRFERFGLKQFDATNHRRSKPVEFEDEAVMILHPDPREQEGKKEYRFELSDEAVRLLDITPGESEITFNVQEVDGTQKLIIVNVTGKNLPVAKKVRKAQTWSNKDYYIYIVENLPGFDTKNDRQICDLEFLKNANGLHAATVEPRTEVEDHTEAPSEQEW